MSGTYVYFVQAISGDGPIKIGYSRLPQNRLVSLMAWAPWPLHILATAPGGKCAERFLHLRFQASRSHSEWFRSTPELLSLIEVIKETGLIPNNPGEYTPVHKPGYRMRCRISDLLATHRLHYSDLQKFLGVKASPSTLAQYGAGTYTPLVVRFFASHGIAVCPDDLYEHVANEEKKLSRPWVTRALSGIAIAKLHAEIRRTFAAKRNRQVGPETFIAVVDALNALLVPKYGWVRRRNIADATGLKLDFIYRIIPLLIAADIVELNGAGIPRLRFTARVEGFDRDEAIAA